MKILRVYFFTISLLLTHSLSSHAQLPKADILKTPQGEITIQPVFHGAMVFKWKEKAIYIDPYNGKHAYKGLPAPDFILITHIHQDHMDTTTLNALNTSKSKLIVPQAVADRLPAKWKNKIVVLSNDQTFTDDGVSITAVPMYDLPQDAHSRHIKGMGNGYVLMLGGKRIYVSGDTDDIPEVRSLKNIDVAFICMNQPFTMTIQQAASAALEFKPAIIYPYHYRDMNGFSNIEAFKKIVDKGKSGIEVRIRNWYEEISEAGKVAKFENVVYGMSSGAAMTMNVYMPEHSNQTGVLVIPGTAFGYAYSAEYGQPSMTENFLRDTEYFGKYARMLLDKGYVLFVINHRLAPQFQYQDIIADCQRAVRFIRFHAQRYDIDPAHIGAIGYSSGATLCSLLGVKDRDIPSGQTGVEAMSSKVQSVVALAARFDLSDFNKPEDTAIQTPIVSKVLLNYMGELPMVENGVYISKGKYAEASPITHVDKDDASFLIYHSDDDPLAPSRQAVNMHNALVANGIDAKLNMAKKEAHNPIPSMEEVNNWFLTHLKKVN